MTIVNRQSPSLGRAILRKSWGRVQPVFQKPPPSTIMWFPDQNGQNQYRMSDQNRHKNITNSVCSQLVLFSNTTKRNSCLFIGKLPLCLSKIFDQQRNALSSVNPLDTLPKTEIFWLTKIIREKSRILSWAFLKFQSVCEEDWNKVLND